MEVIRPFRYWTLWMSKRHTVTLHYVITVFNDMFDHMDGVMRALAKKKAPCNEDWFCCVKLARQKLYKYYAEVTPTTGMLLISAHNLDPFRKLRSFRKGVKGMDINPQDKISYTTQYQEAFLKNIANEYCAKTSMCAGQSARKISDQQSGPLCNGFQILPIILRSIWFVQQ